MKKRIVCFGDSNTWGSNASNNDRFDDHERWTGVLQRELGDEYTIIEEGLGGRTTVWDDPIELYKNGYKQLFPVMQSHKPFHLIIIMLGTNDLKRRFSVTARDIAQSAALLASEALHSNCGPNNLPPKVLLAAPIEVGANILSTCLSGIFEADSVIRSRQFDGWFSKLAAELGCSYINAAEFAKPDPIDCIHIAPEGHRALGIAMANKVKSIVTVQT